MITYGMCMVYFIEYLSCCTVENKYICSYTPHYSSSSNTCTQLGTLQYNGTSNTHSTNGTGHMADSEILPFAVMKFPRQFVAPTDTSLLTTIHQSTPSNFYNFQGCSSAINMFSLSPRSLFPGEKGGGLQT